MPEELSKGIEVSLAITDAQTGELDGSVGLHGIDRGNGTAEIMTYDQANNNRLTEFRVDAQRVVTTYSYHGDGKRLEEVIDIGPGPGPGGGDPAPFSIKLLSDANNPFR